MSTTEDVPISPSDDMAREMQELELALLRGGIEERSAERQRCSRCRRTPLIGENVYRYEHGVLVCELCRSLEPGAPLGIELVHGPAYGNTIRVIDQRAA
jgi:ribosomal protein L37AE/L43A